MLWYINITILLAFSLNLIGINGTKHSFSTRTINSKDFRLNSAFNKSYEWWGPKERKFHQDTSIRPFTITWDKRDIFDLRHRLRFHRPFTPPLEGVGFQYGFNTAILNDWLKYWADGYDFEYRERLMNLYPSFVTNVQGLDIYFIRVRPEVPPDMEVVPLLALHGWPGSVLEFRSAVPLLTAVDHTRDFAVELIVPSLPGFGYSDGAVRPGLGASEIAVVLNNLMQRLGHHRYYVQGGDLGAVTGSYMATMFPDNVLGYHANLALAMTPQAVYMQVVGSIYPPAVVNTRLANRMYPLYNIFSFIMEETGYFHEQATKPDTVGISLSDSPASLLTYVLEKFSIGTGRENKFLMDGGLYNMDRDWLIDNLMLYWIPNAMTTAMRFYAETFNKRQFALGIHKIPTPVPVWFIQARTEVVYQPPLILRTKYPNMLNVTALDVGGHFLAMERPELLAEDVLRALAAFRRWHASDSKGVSSNDENKSSQLPVWLNSLKHILQDGYPPHPEAWWITALIRNIFNALETVFTL